MDEQTLRTLLPLLLPLLVLQLALVVAALWDLAHRERVRWGHKWLWVAVILLVNTIGSLAYFLFGREE